MPNLSSLDTAQLNALPCGAFILDTQGNYVFVNNYWCQITGYSKEEVIGHNWVMIISEDERSHVLRDWLESVPEVLEFNKAFSLSQKNGKKIQSDVKIIPFFQSTDKPEIYLGLLTDQSQTKLLEELRDKFFDESPNLLAIGGVDGYLRRANSAWQKVLGYTEEELSVQPFYEFVFPDDKEKGMQRFQDLIDYGLVRDAEIRIKTKSGHVKWIVWSGVYSVSDQLVYITAHEITKQKHAQIALELQYDLTVLLLNHSSLEEAAQEILQIICKRLDWHLGFMWLIDSTNNSMCFQDAWYEGSNSRYQAFVEISKPFTFHKGEGLPGRIWKDRSIHWIPDIMQEPNFPRAPFARQANFQSAFAIPILTEKADLGVIECFSETIEMEDPALFSILKSVSYQLGEFAKLKDIEKQVSFLASIVDSSESAIIGKDLQGKIISWNESATRLYLYRKEEIIGKPYQILYPKTRLHESDLVYKRIIEGDVIDNFETVRLRKGGEEIEVSLSISPIYNAEGRITGISSISRDITKQKLVEKELKRINALHQAILDSSIYMFISVDTTGMIQTFSKAAEENLGYKAEELIGKSTPIVFHDLDEIEQRSKNLTLELGIPIHGFDVFTTKPRLGMLEENEWTYIRKDGSRFPVYLTITALRNNKEEITGFLGVIRDLSEKRQYEKALIKEERRFLALVDNSIDSIITLEPSGIILTYNQASQVIFEYYPQEVIGQNLTLLLDPSNKEDVFAFFMEVSEHAEESFNGIKREVFFRRKSGQIFSAEISISAVSLEGSIQLICITRDISERKRLDTMKNEFVSNVSHELRTPMTSISGSLGLILGDQAGTVTSETRKLLEIAYRNSVRLGRLINDILDLDKMEAGKMIFKFERSNLTDILQHAVEISRPFADQCHVSLILEQPHSSIPVHVDSDRLIQVLVNLISNALKFSLPGGEVIVNAHKSQGRVKVSIIDQGQGIPEEFQSRLFQKFAQVDASDKKKRSGTGLGLYISKMIIEKMKGTIGVVSEPGVGSTFFFELDELIPSPTHGNGVKKILICEDDPDACSILEMILQAHGFGTEVAYSAEEACERLKKESFAALTLDISLPGKNGLFLLDKLREEQFSKDFSVIVLSGNMDPQEDLMDNPHFPIIAWLPKPIDARLLATVLSEVKVGVITPRKRILYVEVERNLCSLTLRILEGLYNVTTVHTIAEATHLAKVDHYDLMLIDLNEPDDFNLTKAEVFESINPSKIPILIFTSYELPLASTETMSILVKTKISIDELLHTIQKLVDTHREAIHKGG